MEAASYKRQNVFVMWDVGSNDADKENYCPLRRYML
jgi:hypothetical protein